MADCHDLFQKYHDMIKLNSSKKELLRNGKNALRRKIKEYFSNTLKVESPKFWSQGSYSLRTIVNPIDGEYDIDDGVYLQNIGTMKDEWPMPQTVHEWIYNAVEGHTKEDPLDKRTCIRVVYSGQYHIDLPIYGIYNNEYYLAERGKRGWNVSDPKILRNWFMGQLKENGEQLRTIVKYLKAWADYQAKTKQLTLPSGLVLSVLVVESYTLRNRDDAAFGRTVRDIYQRVSDELVVYNPVDRAEILTEHLTDQQKEDFIKLILRLMGSANEALGQQNKKEACKIWRKEFGDRFPCCDGIKELDETVLHTKAPAILKDDGRSA